MLNQYSRNFSKCLKPTLNKLAALPKSQLRTLRASIQEALSSPLANFHPSSNVQISEAALYLPLSIGDFTDYSCSRDHVLNASEAVFKKRELPSGFEYFPVGYTGRTSSIVVSGTAITRPKGQFRDIDGKVVFGPTRRLDYELEVACVIGMPNKIGESISVADADDHIFGVVLMNDWSGKHGSLTIIGAANLIFSARDIQGLEMTPLGPLNGKSFGTTISPWVVTLEALEPFRSISPSRNSAIPTATYLQDPRSDSSYTINLSATVQSSEQDYESLICTTQFSSLYWTLRDIVAQQTINGCNLNTGDLLATGTVSGNTPESHGCLMEVAASGGVDIKNEQGNSEKKLWLADGDTVKITGLAGLGVGFGECVGNILPPR